MAQELEISIHIINEKVRKVKLAIVFGLGFVLLRIMIIVNTDSFLVHTVSKMIQICCLYPKIDNVYIWNNI
jgi:hypothetical protein